MKAALLDERGGLRTYAVVLGTGDEAIAALTEFAANHHLQGSHFTAIGGFLASRGCLFRLAVENVPQSSD